MRLRWMFGSAALVCVACGGGPVQQRSVAEADAPVQGDSPPLGVNDSDSHMTLEIAHVADIGGGQEAAARAASEACGGASEPDPKSVPVSDSCVIQRGNEIEVKFYVGCLTSKNEVHLSGAMELETNRGARVAIDVTKPAGAKASGQMPNLSDCSVAHLSSKLAGLEPGGYVMRTRESCKAFVVTGEAPGEPVVTCWNGAFVNR
ncbi:MAG: hypothetical protein H6718_11920 [Polyangiaceae bacterium]|nr:hypothetical protein [Myxococcales bacterium]MCB9586099.1 hypothetical protein [Polyangiaceae bacterium]MCB9608884.1 hypothetical protein [Polyangiaceae bacterium]